jgi:hypothetical protein
MFAHSRSNIADLKNFFVVVKENSVIPFIQQQLF